MFEKCPLCVVKCVLNMHCIALHCHCIAPYKKEREVCGAPHQLPCSAPAGGPAFPRQNEHLPCANYISRKNHVFIISPIIEYPAIMRAHLCRGIMEILVAAFFFKTYFVRSFVEHCCSAPQFIPFIKRRTLTSRC